MAILVIVKYEVRYNIKRNIALIDTQRRQYQIKSIPSK